MKSGKSSTEFKLTLLVNIVAAALSIAAAYGFLTAEEQAVWLVLGEALIVVIGPLVMALVTKEYTRGRSNVKAANAWEAATASKEV